MFCCCVIVCISRLPLPLLDRVPVVVVAAAVVFQLPLTLLDCVGVFALGGKDVMVTKMYGVDAAKGLLSETKKQTNTRQTVIATEAIEANIR